ncbi:hypothetical protein BJ742DRAFT_236461 [Cladochytrium replicatum]|nr:hypothetical protein BJ742DRAFT_236461 [Cladochytrium replicatum]
MGASTTDRKLYVGNLDIRCTEVILHQLFAVMGEIASVKIVHDKNPPNSGYCYGFVEYKDRASAEAAVVKMNGKKVLSGEIRVNWAHPSSASKEDVSNHFHIFVGDLSPEVNDQNLAKAFSAFGSMSDARVMWDSHTGKSRGYGFVAFRERSDADQAIQTMNGEWLGSRPIRVNWANQKSTASITPASYESVVAQTPPYNTTVYVGNLAATTSQQDLVPAFIAFGYILEVRMQADRGFAFVKFDTHEHAAGAIVGMNGRQLHGRVLKCDWGKDRVTDAQPQTQTQQPFFPYPFQPPPHLAPYGYFPGLTAIPTFDNFQTMGMPFATPPAVAAAAAAAVRPDGLGSGPGSASSSQLMLNGLHGTPPGTVGIAPAHGTANMVGLGDLGAVPNGMSSGMVAAAAAAAVQQNGNINNDMLGGVPPGMMMPGNPGSWPQFYYPTAAQ